MAKMSGNDHGWYNKMMLEDVSLPIRWIVGDGGGTLVHGTYDGAWLSWGMVDMFEVYKCLG